MAGSAVIATYVTLYRLNREKEALLHQRMAFLILGEYRTVGQSRPGAGAERQRDHRHEETDGPLASDRLPAGTAVW